MKKDIEAARKYRFADADLKQLADNLLLFLDRDALEFSDWGFDTNRRAELVQRIVDFTNIDSDETLEGIKITATEEKTARRDELEVLMRTISLKAKIALGTSVGKLKEFGETAITRLNDNELVRNARVMQKAAEKYIQELSRDGFTQAKIQELKMAIASLDNAIDAQIQAISARDGATQTRIETGNKLYELVRKYSDIGKEIFYTRNEAKYNDYVVYDTPASNPKPSDEAPPTTQPEKKE